MYIRKSISVCVAKDTTGVYNIKSVWPSARVRKKPFVESALCTLLSLVFVGAIPLSLYRVASDLATVRGYACSPILMLTFWGLCIAPGPSRSKLNSPSFVYYVHTFYLGILILKDIYHSWII